MTLLRNESFVPLTAAPSAGQDREFRVAVIPANQQAKSFHSLEQLMPEASEAGVASDGKKLCEPRVSVQRDGDRVTSIRIQCTCGQVMDIACVYDQPARPA
jgi:hypothetical protein